MTRRLQQTTVFLLLGSTLLLAACDNASPPEEKPRTVKLVTVGAASVQGQLELAGEVRARTESALGFRVAGKMIARQAEAGQRVHKGQALAKLDPRDYALAQTSAESQVVAAQADVEVAQAELRRYQELRTKNFVSELDLERKRVAAAAAEARLTGMKSGATLEGNRLEDSVLRADADGVVTNVLADTGEVVAAGQPVVILALDGAREIVVEFPEDRTPLARIGRAEVTLWAQPGVKYPAQLRELAAAADPVTRTFRARYSVKAPANALALGQSATVRLVLPAQKGGARLPTTALIQDHGQTKVWQFDPATGVLKGVLVKVAGIDGNEVIVAGLTSGAQVVVAGVHVLSEGQKVRPLAPSKK
jgi:multidrug efflux system membrane fusion protein